MMLLVKQLRVRGWVAVTLPFLFGYVLNGLTGFDLNYLVLLTAMFLYNAYGYTYNDLADSATDKDDPLKKDRNLFCGEEAWRRAVGRAIILVNPVLCILLAFYVSTGYGLFAVFLVIVGFLYSSPLFAAKARPIWDWVFHGMWLPLMFIPGYLYFFEPDRLFFVLLALLTLNSIIGQINNQLTDFELDSVTRHKNTVLLLGKRRSFFVRMGLELALVALFLWITVLYRYPATMAVILPTFAYFFWIERIRVLRSGDLQAVGDYVHVRLFYIMSAWVAVLLVEQGIRMLA